MYLRTIQRRNRDGSVVRYLQLAHNHRKGTSTQAEVLVSLGREDQLDVEGLRRLVGSIGRYLDGTRGLPAASPVAGAGVSGLVVESSRPIGATWLLDGLWQQLGIAEALGGGAGPAEVHHRCGAGTVRAGRRASGRAGVQAGHRRLGLRGRRDPGAGQDGQGPGVQGDGPAGRRRYRRRGAAGGVLRRRRPAQPGGRPAAVRHHLDVLPNGTSPSRARTRSGCWATPRTTGPTCRRS